MSKKITAAKLTVQKTETKKSRIILTGKVKAVIKDKEQLSIQSARDFYYLIDKNVLSLILQFTLTNVKECYNLRLVSKQFATCVSMPMNHSGVKLHIRSISNEFPKKLNRSFPGLRHLVLEGIDGYWRRFNDNSKLNLAITLGRFSLLQSLSLVDIEFKNTQEGTDMIEYIGTLINLRELFFIRCHYYNIHDLSPLIKLVNLRSIHVEDYYYDINKLKFLAEIKSLQELTFYNPRKESSLDLVKILNSKGIKFNNKPATLLNYRPKYLKNRSNYGGEKPKYLKNTGNYGALCNLVKKDRKSMDNNILAMLRTIGLSRDNVKEIVESKIEQLEEKLSDCRKIVISIMAELRSNVEKNVINYYTIKRQIRALNLEYSGLFQIKDGEKCAESVNLVDEFNKVFSDYDIGYESTEFKNYEREIVVEDKEIVYIDTAELAEQVKNGKEIMA